jgi:hypothetical protein
MNNMEKVEYWWAWIKWTLLSIMVVVYIYVKFIQTITVNVAVVDKYEGLKYGTTTFFVETCIKNDMKKCELDSFSRRDYDMIEIGENWRIEVRNSEYR